MDQLLHVCRPGRTPAAPFRLKFAASSRHAPSLLVRRQWPKQTCRISHSSNPHSRGFCTLVPTQALKGLNNGDEESSGPQKPHGSDITSTALAPSNPSPAAELDPAFLPVASPDSSGPAAATSVVLVANDDQPAAAEGLRESAVDNRHLKTAGEVGNGEPVSKAFALTFAPGAIFMFLSVLPPVLFILHRVFVVVLQLIVFVICNIIYADRAVPPLMWRDFCRWCLETSSLLDELVPVLLLALAGLQQGFMDIASGVFRTLLLAPVLIPGMVALAALCSSPAVHQAFSDLVQKLPEGVRSRCSAAAEKLRLPAAWGKMQCTWANLTRKVPSAWGEKILSAWESLQTPAAQQALLQGSILVMTGWLASVFTEPLRPGARNGTLSLILFILLRIATFVVDVAVMKELWRGLRTTMQGSGSLQHWVGSNQRVVRLAVGRAVLELLWAMAIGLRFMYGITTGWKVFVALYLLYFASSTWQFTQEQAQSWPQGSWGNLALHAVMAMIVSWPLCLPSWEALPELGIIHKGSHGFWGSL